LKELATKQEIASTFNFLNKKLMVVDRVVLELNDYEKKQFTSSSHGELRSALLEINVRALLITQVVGEELLKEDTSAVEKLKAEFWMPPHPSNPL